MAQSNEIKFGTDGWRGIIARDFTFENVRKVARATADAILNGALKQPKTPGSGVIIGYDRRFLSERFAAEAAGILKANKIDVSLTDRPVPTPAVSLMTQKKFGMGIMITASHNPHIYNGFKVKTNGRTAPESITSAIENNIGKTPVAAAKFPEISKKSLHEPYLNYLNSKMRINSIAKQLRKPVVFDFMHGCAAEVMGGIIKSKNIVSIHAKHDPMFGGIPPEPVEQNLQELIKTVQARHASAGIAFDGDADRIGLVDDCGKYMTPCQIFPLLLEYLLHTRKLRGKIVQAVSMGYMAKRIARSYSLPFEEVPVGFKFIAEKMLTEDVAMGAEESGGYAWKGNLPERDSALNALLILEMLTTTKKKISQLYAEIEKKHGKSCFQRCDLTLIKIIPDKSVFAEKLKKKIPKTLLGRNIAEINGIDGLKVILDNDHWFLMRPSGTEPLLRTYAETDSPSKTKELLNTARKLVEKLM